MFYTQTSCPGRDSVILTAPCLQVMSFQLYAFPDTEAHMPCLRHIIISFRKEDVVTSHIVCKHWLLQVFPRLVPRVSLHFSMLSVYVCPISFLICIALVINPPFFGQLQTILVQQTLCSAICTLWSVSDDAHISYTLQRNLYTLFYSIPYSYT